MAEVRKTLFKNKGKDSESLRRQRSDITVEIRKQKKDEQLFKRRNVHVVEETTERPVVNKEQTKILMTDISTGIFSDDPSTRLRCTESTRRILSRERDPPIDVVIESGVIPRLVQFLYEDSLPALQMEAAWALTNVASGTSIHTHTVVNAGGIQAFIKLLSSDMENLAEQAVWALGNIAGDGPELRDMTIHAGIIDPLLRLIRQDTPITGLRNISWTISNLCRNKYPSPPFDAVRHLLPALTTLLHHPDIDVVTDSCWAFSYLTDGTDDKISEVVSCNIIPRVIDLLNGNRESLLTPALRTIGNIVTGTEEQTQMVIDSGALCVFHNLLTHNKNSVQKEAAWTISNIMAGSIEQIQAVIDASLLPWLREVLANSDFRAQKEAAWAITNMTSGGTPEQVMLLVEQNFLPSICKLLEIPDVKLVLIALDAIYNILKAEVKAETVKQVCWAIEECNGLDRIEELQEHENHNIYSLAFKIIDEFFSDEKNEIRDAIEGAMHPPGDSDSNFNHNNAGTVRFQF